MPIYEYECATHGVFDKLITTSAIRDAVVCPECEEAAVRLEVSRIGGIEFKGNGWFKTTGSYHK